MLARVVWFSRRRVVIGVPARTASVTGGAFGDVGETVALLGGEVDGDGDHSLDGASPFVVEAVAHADVEGGECPAVAVGVHP